MMVKKVKGKTIQASVNIGLIGHVDAGKTSLVEALTGRWVDTHSEELKRGISIRIGYADASIYLCPKCKRYFSIKEKCPYCGAKGEFQRKVSFVDAPGHETLMTTMLSGAALMHGAILVIAANEHCPQAQTIEHLNAIQISGVKNIVVAQNKIDLVSKEQALQNYKEIVAFLKEYNCQATIVPTAAHLRVNIDLLIEAIEKHIASPKFDANRPLKMYCGRSFDINKPGTKPAELKGGVLGGTIMQGGIKKGQKIEISPGPLGKKIVTEVLGISCADGPLEEAKPGGLIAIETQLDPSITQNDQMRGQLIGKPGTLPEPSEAMDLEVSFLERAVADIPKELKMNESVVLTIGSMSMLGKIVKVKGNRISVKLKKPAAFWKGQNVAISKLYNMRWRLVGYGKVV